MSKIAVTSQFKKDLKKIKKRRQDFLKVTTLLKILEEKGVSGIPKRMSPHRLNGRYRDNWECHIKPNLLVIFIQINEENQITMVRIGSHSELFK